MMSVRGCPTKKSLKQKIGQVASDVLVETSMDGPELRDNMKGEAIVGPGPYDRKWYAQVTIKDCLITKVT